MRRFGDRVALDRISVSFPSGGVIGFVGPNGSGKSTLIRTVLGLIRPSHGTAMVLGQPITDQDRIAGRVGALIENPAFVPMLSARANLTALARLRGLPNNRIDAVLQTVGLAGRDREPVRGFSLGMKQRLGIAAALLPDPELLVLDEPTNGLDPAGIVEIRELLRDLGRQGRTVVVSSHMLAEIQAVCDHVVMIRFGKLLFAGRIEELLARSTDSVDVAPEHHADLGKLLRALAVEWAGEAVGDGIVRLVAPASATPAINRVAATAGITLARLMPRTETLEDLFLSMTGDDDPAASVAASTAITTPEVRP